MKLTRIKYESAVFLGIFALVIYLIAAILQFVLVRINPSYEALVGAAGNIQLLVYTPLIGGIVAYAFALLAILIYNNVAKKFPISWDVKK